MTGDRPLIVTYHGIGSGSQLAVTEDALAAQLSLLRRSGFQGLTFADAERRRHAGTLPARAMVVTFDDGYRSTLRAVPILRSFGVPATVFVVTRFVECGEIEWAARSGDGEAAPSEERESMTWIDLEQLQGLGWEIGSHTVTHPNLLEVPDGRLAQELGASKESIERHLGACETVAYPYGFADHRVARAAAQAGYLAGATVSSAFRPDERHRRPRLVLTDVDVHARLRVKVSRSATWCRGTRAAETLVVARRAHRRRAARRSAQR